MVEAAYRIKNSFKYNKLIENPKQEIENMMKILNSITLENNITEKDMLLYINALEYHNDREISKKDLPEEQEITKQKYNEIPNILSIGFQEHDVVEVSFHKKTKLDALAIEIMDKLKEDDSEEIIDIISLHKTKDIEDNEYNYIILKILDLYLEELEFLYKLLLEKDTYTQKESRDYVVKTYYQTLSKYLKINQYYDNLNEYFPDETIDTTIDYQNKKRLIYTHSVTNITKARIIADMHDLSDQYYHDTYDLITRFKNGTLTANECKMLHNHKKLCGHIELRDDQIRIIIKHIRDDIYCVLGVFAKKSDNDTRKYGTIINRGTPDITTEEKINMQLELANKTEEELEKLVKEKGRKGSR